MDSDIQSVLLTGKQIFRRVKGLAREIDRDYKGKEVLLVGILKGACVFCTDLIREMKVPVKINFMALSSYGSCSVSSGAVRIQYDLEENIEGKNVLIIEDIIDTGLTLSYLFKTLLSRNPASLKVCCLLDKPERRKTDFKPDYTGFKVPDKFLVGYGLDYSEKYRNLKYIGVLKPEVYK